MTTPKPDPFPLVKLCEGCGVEFMPLTRRATRCKKGCGRKDTRRGPRESKNAARNKRRAESGVTFVGIDGEGYNTKVTGYEWEEIEGELVEVPVEVTEHRYNMLSVGDHTFCTPRGEQMSYNEALQHIWDSAEEYRRSGERICLVGFFLGYDFIQIFRTLPEDVAWKLFSKAGQEMRRALQAKNGWKRIPKVRVGPWRLDMMAGKRLTICHIDHPGVTVTVCDVGAFFQTSFLNAINPKDWLDPICTPEEFEIIKRGKEARGGTMTVEALLAEQPETIQYNITENIVLARLMTRLDEGFRHNAIHLRADQFYGPGQAAQTWMSNIEAPTSEELAEALPTHMFKITQGSYYGGWFEIFAHGHVPGITWEFDITSAYPDVIRRLPCLLCGEWRPDHDGILRIAKYHVRAPAGAVTGPLPHRRRDGTILRPLETRGYHWRDEVEAAERAGLVEEYISVEDRWSFHRTPCRHKSAYPFKEIETLFLDRIKVGKKSPAGKALKLVYNSAYGKTAQSVGMPKFASPVYASLITSGCRTKILNAIAAHPKGAKALVMVATDAVFFRSHVRGATRRLARADRQLEKGKITLQVYGEVIEAMAAKEHPKLDMRPNTLGAWEGEIKRNLTLFMPGVYWDDKAREAIASGGKLSLKSRGISAKELSKYIGEIDRQFSEWDGTTYRIADDGTFMSEWPTLTLYSEFGLVSLPQALERDKWGLAGTLMTYQNDEGETVTGVRRVITADAKSKRARGEFQPLFQCAQLERDGDLWRSWPYAAVMLDGEKWVDTTPYSRGFGHDLHVDQVMEAAASPDGDPFVAMMQVLKGD
ncbi:hypothetical protein ABZ208_37465 [Streptomyces sp. NPDC006208]|uniref:hypothetical protein n=1 Tax=Streptomyces sp. NPDC006208 TaxID=3156734 RepID=UPI0033B2DF07